jgi:hypothetical protein
LIQTKLDRAVLPYPSSVRTAGSEFWSEIKEGGERELDFLLILIGYYAFSLVTMFADMANLVKIDMSLTALSYKFILIKISFNTSLLEFI